MLEPAAAFDSGGSRTKATWFLDSAVVTKTKVVPFFFMLLEKDQSVLMCCAPHIIMLSERK